MSLKGSENVRLARYNILAELDKHQTSNLVMVGVVSLFPIWSNLIFLKAKSSNASILKVVMSPCL